MASRNDPMRPPPAHVVRANATAATPSRTRAYSAVVWPRSSFVSSGDGVAAVVIIHAHRARHVSIIDMRTLLVLLVVRSSAAQRRQGAGEQRRHGQQREGREDAHHEGEDE